MTGRNEPGRATGEQPTPLSRPVISVVVPTYQRRSSVVRLLDALTAQTYPAAQFEVVLAVDGSTDGTAEAVADLALPYRVVVAQQDNRGRSAARNMGVARSRGRVLLFLDDDMEPAPGLVGAHADAHADTTGAQIETRTDESERDEPVARVHARLIGIGPMPIRARSDSVIERYRAAVFDARHRRLADGRTPTVRDASMGNLSVPRSLLEAAGGVDEEFQGYGLEDYELVQRLIDAGGAIRFLPSAVATQHYEKTLSELARDVEEEGWNSVLFARKHPNSLSELELGNWSGRSSIHRRVLTMLLRATLRHGHVRAVVIGAATLVSRFRFMDPRRILDHTFDYLFWLGVCREPGGPGPMFARGAPMEQALAAAGLVVTTDQGQRR